MASKNGYTLGDLFQSATYGDLDTLTKTIESGISVESATIGGSSVLHFAAYGGQTRIVSHLLKNYPECVPKGHELDMQGYNALHNCCAFSGNIGVFQQLVRAGFDKMAKTSSGLTALELAEEFEKNDLVGYIRASESGDSIGQPGISIEDLGLSDQRNDTELSLSLNEDDDEDDKENRRYTIADILLSAERGDVEGLDNIVRSGIPIDSTTKGRSSVLHFAACNGQSKMIHHLVDKYPACVVKGQVLDYTGYNVLHYAARSGKVEMFEKLLSCGFDIKARTDDGRTVLDLAGEAKQTEMIRHLSEYAVFDFSYIQIPTLPSISMVDSGFDSMPRSSAPIDVPDRKIPSESGISDAVDKSIPEYDERPPSTGDTFTHTKRDSYGLVHNETPEDSYRNWISLHQSAAEGNSYDVLRMIENGANPMKKINSAFFPNIHLKPKQMLTPLEVALFSKKEDMLPLLIRYTNDEIVRRCLSMCVSEYVTLKPYVVKGMLEKKYKGKFIEVVFGEYKPKKHKIFVIYTDIIAHGSETNEAGYTVHFRNPSVSSDESRKTLYHCQQKNYILSEDDRKLVTKAIKQHSDKLWKDHSNLKGIMSSPVKSAGGSFKKQACLVILCHFKGFVPDKEPEFPSEVKVGEETLPVDVREGHVALHHVQCPNALHKPLSFGCNIGTADDPTYRFGSIGPFVQLQDGKIGFITCAHVVNGHRTHVADSVPNIHVLQPSTGNTEYPEDERMCGNVVYLRYSLNEDTSIDVAVVEITVPSRAPLSPGFAAYSQEQLYEQGIPENQPIFDHGEYGEPTVGGKIVKFGSASGVTYGTYRGIRTSEFSSRIYGRTSETERWRGIYYIENRQCSEDDCNPPPFSTPGDSGAGVFQIRDSNLICVGILVGADEATGSGIVIPIKPILETSKCNLKVFRPRT